MSRRIPDKPKNLDDLVKEYGERKVDESKLKTIISDLNTEIKTQLKNSDRTSYDNGEYTVTLSFTPREDFDDARAIDILKDSLPDDVLADVVRTKEYIDDDALERAIYNRQFDVDLIASCKTVIGYTERLTIKKSRR